MAGRYLRQGKLASNFRFYFANTTSWGQKAWDYLNQDGGFQEADLIMIAEHHLRGGQHIQAIKRLKRLGWST
eukprot:4483829-Pyramimonas_sp.AAC.1